MVKDRVRILGNRNPYPKHIYKPNSDINMADDFPNNSFLYPIKRYIPHIHCGICISPAINLFSRDCVRPISPSHIAVLVLPPSCIHFPRSQGSLCNTSLEVLSSGFIYRCSMSGFYVQLAIICQHRSMISECLHSNHPRLA